MASSPQKASWRRIDTTLIPSDDVGAGGERSASGQQSTPAGQDVSSTRDNSLSPSTTSQTTSSPSITISPSSFFPSSSIPLSDASSTTNTQSIVSPFGTPILTVSSSGPSSFVVSNSLAPSGPLPAVIPKPFAAVAIDAIVPSSSGVQSTPHTVVDPTLPASTLMPVPASTSPGIDDGSSLTSTSQIIRKPPVSFGGDAPPNSADLGFSDVLDVVSLAIPTPTGGQSQEIATATRLVNTSIPNGETGPVPPTSAPTSGEIGISISTITSSATTAVSTTDFTSIPPSGISGQLDFFNHNGPFNHDDDDRFKTTSLFTATTEVVLLSLTEISGTQTSIPITVKTTTVLPTVVPVHFHKSLNRSVPVAVIAIPILSVAVIITLVLFVLRRRWRLQHQRMQARIQWPTYVGFSQVREMHQESMLRSREEAPPSLPPLQSTVGWNDPSPGSFTFGEPAQDPFAPTPPMIFRPLRDASPSPPLDRPLSVRTVRRVPVPDPFLGRSGPTSALVGSPEGSNRFSQTSSHDEHGAHAPTNVNNVGWAV